MMCTFRIFILLFLFQIYNVNSDEQCDRERSERPAHLKLKESLFCGYDKTIRPVKDSKTTTIVDAIQLLKSFDVNEYAQEFSVNGWFVLRWKDEHMQWNAEDYDNTKYIMVTASEIWIPDISSYGRTGLTKTAAILESDSECFINNNSYVLCVTTTSMESDCVLNMKHFPYDVHNCTFRLGSWVHKGEEITYNVTFLDLHDEYFYNPSWHLEHKSVTKQVVKLDCCPDSTFPSLNYNFVVRRNPGGHIFSYVLPYIDGTAFTEQTAHSIISKIEYGHTCIQNKSHSRPAMMIMTLVAMWMDPNFPDRIYITALNIPCHLLFIESLGWEIPEQGDEVPYLVALLRDSLLMASATLVETVLVRGLLSTKKDSPRWLASFMSQVVSTKVGQLILFSELDPQMAVENITAEDSSNLIGESSSERPKEWYLLGRIIDRLAFVIYILTYVTMFLLFIPK